MKARKILKLKSPIILLPLIRIVVVGSANQVRQAKSWLGLKKMIFSYIMASKASLLIPQLLRLTLL